MPSRASSLARRLAGRGAALALVCWVRAAAAALSADVRVERAPEASDCPDAPQLADAVNRSLGRAAAHAASGKPADVSLRVRFIVDGRGYLAFVEASGRREGTRRLDDAGATCAGVAEAVALTTALLLDDDAARQEASPTKNATRPAAAEPPPRARQESRSKRGTSLGVEAGALLGTLLADPLGAGVYAEGRAALGRTFTVGGGGLWLPDRVFRGVEPGQVVFRLFAGTLAACWTPLRLGADIELGVCARPALGALLIESSGYRQTNRNTGRFWAAAGASADVSGPLLGGVRWTGRVGGFLPLRGERLVVDEQLVYRSSAPTFFVGAGVRVTIW